MNLKDMNVSSIKTNSADSPKTPGGISKSLLTPCRRVGLSRKWRKSSVSPFISPLSNDNTNKEVKEENEIRKRKKCESDVGEKDIEGLSETCSTPKVEIDRTPRTLLPRKKSKTLIPAQKSKESKNEPQCISELSDKIVISNENQEKCEWQDISTDVSEFTNLISEEESVEEEPTKKVTKVSKLSRKNSKSSIKLIISDSPTKNTIRPEPIILSDYNNLDIEKETLPNIHTEKESVKVKSPNNLTKECIVVIQKKIFKTGKQLDIKTLQYDAPNKLASQTLFDSDSDDVPLSNLNKLQSKTSNKNDLEQKIHVKEPLVDIIRKPEETNDIIKQQTINNNIKQNTQNIDFTNKDLDDNDFVESKKVNNKKIEKTSTTVLKNKAKPKTNKPQPKFIPKPLQTSNLCEEDDDFDYNRTRTILIKKTYDKVPKLSKAKSTGSITQKDIDDVTARLERKKDLLLAKSMTNETKELRDLIKKWQIGCQTALMELMDLMKKKMPEQNMDHSELLQMLKIPPDLVGYDSESDSFNTPDDAAIILSALKLN